jgi:hypothetical protein
MQLAKLAGEFWDAAKEAREAANESAYEGFNKAIQNTIMVCLHLQQFCFGYGNPSGTHLRLQ